MKKIIKVLLLAFICQLCTIAKAEKLKKQINLEAKVRVILDSNSTADKVWVTYKNHLWATHFYEIPNIQLEKSGMDNLFDISFLPNEKGAYISVKFTRDNSIEDFIIEPGDSIVCTYYKNKWYFTGQGHEKFQCQYDILEAKKFVPRDMSIAPKKTSIGKVAVLDDSYTEWLIKGFKRDLKSTYTASQIALNVLEWYKEHLSDFAYNLIKANVVSNSEATATKLLTKINGTYGENNTDSTNRKKLLNTASTVYSLRAKYDLKVFCDTVLAYSAPFLSFKTAISDTTSYINLKNNYKGFLRDRLLTVFILNNYNKNIRMAEWLQDALPLIGDKNCKELLLAKINTLVSGLPAFDFSLQDTSKKHIKLKDFRGKVVFMDFWFTGCGSCKLITEGLKPVVEHFKNNSNVVFIGVSIDADFEDWKKSVKSGLYSNEGSIDLYTNGLKSEHPIIKHYGFSGYPSLLLIDRDGKIITGSPPRPGWTAPSKAKELIELIERNLPK